MKTCSHCGDPMRGHAGLTLPGVHHHLCHPDTGMDCYRLVTVFRHPIVACPCKDGPLSPDRLRVEANGYIGSFGDIDQFIAAIQATMKGEEL